MVFKRKPYVQVGDRIMGLNRATGVPIGVATVIAMMPVKFERAVTYIGLHDSAEWCGLLPPKEGQKQGWTRTVLATGTSSVKRFLTGTR